MECLVQTVYTQRYLGGTAMWTEFYPHTCSRCSLQWSSPTSTRLREQEVCVYCLLGPGEHTDAALDRLISTRREIKKYRDRLHELESFFRAWTGDRSTRGLWWKRLENAPMGGLFSPDNPRWVEFHREALRVGEEFSRLVLEESEQSDRVKDLSYQELAWKDRQKSVASESSLEPTVSGISQRLMRDRSSYLIRKMDYKRGNDLDNYVRRNCLGHILRSFGYECMACGCRFESATMPDLTLDHFWLPKNEGGNFLMYHSRTGRLEANVTVLCRSCNSKKGELEPQDFFSAEQLARIERVQRQLSSWANHEPMVERLATRWYEVEGRRKSRR